MSWLFKEPVVIMKEIMPWPLKDPINSSLLNLTMPNQTIETGIKAKKDQITPNEFFLLKITNKIFMFLLAPFILQIKKRFLELMQSYEDVPFSGPKWSICPGENIFGASHCYSFHLPIGHFQCAIFQKILTADPELWRCAIFGPKMVHLPQTKIFLESYYHSHLPIIAPFIVQNLKKILPATFGPKMAHFPK